MTVTDEDRKALQKALKDMPLAQFELVMAYCRRISQAAYAAGLERAGVIAENYGGKTAYVIATAIRAEKDKA